MFLYKNFKHYVIYSNIPKWKPSMSKNMEIKNYFSVIQKYATLRDCGE